MKKKRYKNGGPIDPNYQTLGNIKFDSNKSRKGPFGQMVVTDELTGKDYGVIRDDKTGAYDFYRGEDPLFKTQTVEKKDSVSTNYKKGTILKSKETEYINDYIDSPKYKERLKKLGANFTPNKDYSIDRYDLLSPEYSQYFPKTKVLKYQTAKDMPSVVDKEAVLVHELSHATGLDSVSKKQLARISKEFLSSKANDHDSNPEEYKADVDAVRYLLRREKIYDASTQDFDESVIEKIKNSKLKRDPTVNRLFRNSKDSNSLIKAFNELVSIEEKNQAQNAATGGHINNNQMKKKKGYFTGGEIAMIAQYVNNMATDYVSAVNYKMDPSADPYKINWSKLLTGGPAGMVPELIKAFKDKKGREKFVATATPGNYSKGGNITDKPSSYMEGTPSQSDNYQVSKYPGTGKGYDASGKKIWRKGSKDDGSGELLSVQAFLKALGFYSGEVDGIYGNKTEKAVKEYQKWFNENAKKEMWYTKDGKNSERIGGKLGKKIAEDGVVGDQTRTALMYREMPKEKTKPKKEWVEPEFPVGESRVKYSAEDYTPTDFPDSPMNYSGGLEMLGLVTLGMGIGGAGLSAAEQAIIQANSGKNLMNASKAVQSVKNLKQLPGFGRPSIQPTVPNPLQGIGGRSFGPKTPSSYGTRIGYATGGYMGDEQLSSSAFEVEANPGKVDSKHYPHLNANLDHGEVVKDNKFVFSNRLKNPATGESFAEEAESLQKSVGKAEKILKTNPRDAFANNTITLSERRTQKLADVQETLATLMGHRKDRPKGMALGGFAGGPGDPPFTYLGDTSNLDFINPVVTSTGNRKRPLTADSFTGTRLSPQQAVMDLGRDGLFYDPYTKRFTVRNSRGEYVGVRPAQGQFSVTNGVINDLKSGKKFDVNQHLQYMKSPRMQTTGQDGPTLGVPSNILPSVDSNRSNSLRGSTDPLNPFGINNVPTTTPAEVNPITNVPPTGGRGRGTGKKASTSKLPTATTSPLDYQDEYNRSLYEEMQAAAANNLPQYRGGDKEVLDPEGTFNQVTSTSPARPGPNIASALNFGKGTTGATADLGDKIYNKFTIGDALQGIEVASKFGQLIGGADVEMPNFDTTRITKETFDPRNAMYQSNRTLQNALNTMEAPSINMRRNMANSLYAQRLGQDNTILSEYNRMNQGANTQFEQRQADQRRYNIGQTTYTEDLNQRNKDTFRNTVQNAFTSLGNFGEQLNAKQQGTDILKILAKTYPQVYKRMMEEWLKEEQAKTKTTK